jgi:hypothetical protein
MLSLLIRNVVFTIVVPGLGGVWVPVWLATRDGSPAVDWTSPVAWAAILVIAAGAVLYLCCAWNFAATGRGTPGPGRAAARGHPRSGPGYLAYRRAVPRWIPRRPGLRGRDHRRREVAGLMGG